MLNTEIKAAVAAACMARGLNRQQACAVWEHLTQTPPAAGFGGVWDQLDSAISLELSKTP